MIDKNLNELRHESLVRVSRLMRIKEGHLHRRNLLVHGIIREWAWLERFDNVVVNEEVVSGVVLSLFLL